MMIRYRHILGMICLCSVVVSCNNPDAFDCVKTTGDQMELNIVTDPFNRIDVNDDIDVFLQNGPETTIKLIGGENLLPKVNITSRDGTLTIENKNKCNWARDYDRIEVYITAPLITEIWHFGFGNIVSLDTLKSNWLLVKGQWCSGDVNLVIDIPKFYYVSNGVSLVTISGKTSRAQLGHYFNDGIFNGEQLLADTVLIDHKGYTRMRVNVKDKLTGQVYQNGSVEYISDSAIIDIEVYGNGKLIKI